MSVNESLARLVAGTAQPAIGSLPAHPGVLYVIPGDWQGMVRPGNIDLNARPVVRNPNGGYSTVDSVSFTHGGHEVLVPKVVGNAVLSNADAWQHFLRTGQHLGVFANPAAANAYAIALHLAQASQYAGQGAKVSG